MRRGSKRKGGGWRRLLLGGLAVLVALGAWEYLGLPDVHALVKENPRSTALIDQRAEEAKEAGRKPKRRQTWVPLESISVHLVDAVVLAEDASFYLHEGIDTVELRKAIGEAIAKGSLGRGASTIPQQLAKNLWLSGERSVVRKAKEMILARRLDAVLPKRRILAIYLNVVEWGDGVYGAEAGAEEHFGVHARELSAAQAATLAAMLPAPRKRLPRLRRPGHYRYARRILTRMHTARRLDAEALARAQRELAELFGVAAPTPEQPEDDVPADEESDEGQ